MTKRAAAEELRELASTWREVLSSAASPAERDGIRGRILRPFVDTLRGAHDQSARHELFDAFLSLHEVESIGRETLDMLAEIADERGDLPMQRRALDELVDEVEGDAKLEMLEKLGDILKELGEDVLAADQWLAAARAHRERSDGIADARRLFERVLEVAPKDDESAGELVRIHLDDGGWDRVPEVVSTVLRADAERGAELLLGLEERALEAGVPAFPSFESMIDEAVALGSSTSDSTRRLRRAGARVLAAQPERHDDASHKYRALLDAFDSPEDVREYESFIASRNDENARHLDRRWLFGWRVERAGSTEQPALLREWAKLEDDHGETADAIAVHQQLLDAVPEAERADVRASLARLLASAERFEDAAAVLAPSLAADPPHVAAADLARELLAKDASRSDVVDRLEAFAGGADDRTAGRVLDFLLGARDETSAMPEARRRWYRRYTGIAPAAPALEIALADARATPGDLPIWEAAERVGRAKGQLDAVVKAYGDVVSDDGTDTALVESLGKRLLALEPDCAVEVSALVTWLERVLERLPVARWALDRVKVALGEQGSWDRLFAVYDRAIDTAANDAQRGELLDEAMFVARDLANDTTRAAQYLAQIHTRRPDDASVTAALERLYERQGNKAALALLLRERLAKSDVTQRRGIQKRLIAASLDIGKIDDAIADLRALVDESDSVADIVDLLERVVQQRPDAFGARLRGHYETAGRIDDAVRVTRCELAGARDDRARAKHVRTLVRLAGEAAIRDAGDNPRLRKVARRALLVASLRAWKRATTDAEKAAAEKATWSSVEALKAFALDDGDLRAAARLLERAATMRFEEARRRTLEHEAAALYADRLNEPRKAVRIYGDLVRSALPEAIEEAVFDRYASLLEAVGEPAKLGRLLETRASRASKRGDREAEAAFWVKAGTLWEAQGADEDPRRAIDAYRHAAELGALAGHEGLARLHSANWRWTEAIESLEWLLERAKENRAAVGGRLANAYVETGATDKARALLRDVLPSVTDAAEARAVRARLLDLYRRDESWPELAEALEQEASKVEGKDRVSQLRQASDVRLAKLDDRAGAIRLLDLAVAADPSDHALRPKLADLLEQAEDWERVAELLGAQAQAEADRGPRDAALLRQRLAHALMRLGRAEDSLAQLRIATKLLPTDGRILLELGKVAFATGDLDAAERAYRALLLSSQSSGVSRIAIYVELVAIAAKRGDAERASNLLESALDAAIESGEELTPVEQAMRSVGRWDLLVRALEHRIARGGAAAVRANALRDLAEAWRSHLGRDPELAARIRGHADLLAKELEDGKVTSSADGAWSGLWSTYAALGDEETLISIIKRHVEAMRRGELNREHWRAWLLDAASLCARLGEIDLAVRLHSVLLEDSPQDEETWTALRAMLDEKQARARLVPLLERAIAATDAGPARAKLRVELASLVDGEAAAEQLTLATGDDPMNDSALASLTSALEREGRFDALAAALQPRLEALGTEDSRWIETAWRLGRAFESSDQSAAAARLYESILDREPSDRETCRKLAHRLEAIESDRLADALELWMRVDPNVARAVAPRVVELRETKGDRAPLARALDAALRADPTDKKLLERFIALHEETEDPVAIADALRRAFEAAPIDLALLRRLVDAQRAIGEEKENLRILDAAIEKDESGALLCLRARVKEGLGDDDGAIADLRAMGHADSGLTQDRIDIVRRILSWKAPPVADELAMMLVDDLVFCGRFDEVDTELAVVLERTPDHSGALFRFGALYTARKDWPRAKATYAKLLSVTERTAKSDHDKLGRVAVAYAGACLRAGEPAEARFPLERVWRIAPAQVDVGEILERVCEATKDWRRLAELIIVRAEHVTSTSEKAALLLESAKLLTDAGDSPGALRTTEAARALDPGNAEVALACAEAYLANGARAHHAIVVLSEAVERNQRKRIPAMASVYFTLAKAHLALDELAEALEALKAGFAIDVRTAELAMLLGQVAVDLDDLKAAERAFVAVTFASKMDGAGTEVTGATKAVALFHLAALAQNRGDLVTARRWASKALTEDSAHGQARELLDELEQLAEARTPRAPVVRS